MDVRVAGHQVDTGETLREHAQRRIAEITREIFLALGRRQRHLRPRARTTTSPATSSRPSLQGVVLKASHSAREAEMAFNGAADRIEKQLRRYTNRLKEHKVDEAAQAYVENAGYTVFSGRAGRRGRQPIIRRSLPKRASIFPNSSVSDAVMLMDLRNTPALMFKNSATGRVQHDLSPRRRKHRLGRAAHRLIPSHSQRPGATGRTRHEFLPMQLADFLDCDAIKTALPGGNKRSLLQAAGRACRAARSASTPAAVLAGLNEREQLGSTGFGQGVAIPHAKIDGLDADLRPVRAAW